MGKIELGPVTDLNRYKSYIQKFSENLGKDVSVVEIHLPESDLDFKFKEKIDELLKFISKTRIKKLAFHSPSGLMGRVFFNEVKDGDLEKYKRLINTLKENSNKFSREIMLVIHQGKIYETEFLLNLSDEEFSHLREETLLQAKESYDKLISEISGSKLIIALEN